VIFLVHPDRCKNGYLNHSNVASVISFLIRYLLLVRLYQSVLLTVFSN
jgi:hypothetical protein